MLRKIPGRLLYFVLAGALLGLNACGSPQANTPRPTASGLVSVESPTVSGEQPTASGAPQAVSGLRVFTLDAKALADAKTQLDGGDSQLQDAFRQVKSRADKALKLKPLSVVEKTTLPPSGDKHDYMSMSPYWWPNPDSSDGLPYVRRDGQTNPDNKAMSDEPRFDDMVDGVQALALAYYFTGQARYAEHATLLLRTWFLDPDTRMNPNMNYGQVIPGKNDGYGDSVLDMRNLPAVIDSIGLLDGAAAWTQAEQQGMTEWFTAYLDWLRTNKVALDDAKRVNNHSSWYHVQVVAIALFLNQNDVAQQALDDVVKRLLPKQIKSNGEQPQELERTRAWFYSVFNLSALFQLATLGEHADRDLWHERASKGGLRDALDYLVPFALKQKSWPYQQITDFDPTPLAPLLRQAAHVYNDQDYQDTSQQLAQDDFANALSLLSLPRAG